MVISGNNLFNNFIFNNKGLKFYLPVESRTNGLHYFLSIHSPYKTCHVSQGPQFRIYNYFACSIGFVFNIIWCDMCFTSVCLDSRIVSFRLS